MVDLDSDLKKSLRSVVAAKRGRAIIADLEMRSDDRDRLNLEANKYQQMLEELEA